MGVATPARGAGLHKGSTSTCCLIKPHGRANLGLNTRVGQALASKISGTGQCLHKSGFHGSGGEAMESRRHSSLFRPR
jgi:hypothetical protein